MADEVKMQITVSKLKEYAKDIQVLYVEDDIHIRKEIHDFLSRFFPVIDLASDGEEGLALYQKGHYDIVITDINMPKMNGIEMINAIKTLSEEQKVIVTSAYSESDYFIALIDAGVDKFVMKPLDNKKFLLVLYKISELIYNKQQRVLLEEKMAKKAAETQTIVDMIEHGVILIDEGRVTQMNKQFLEMAGYDSMESFHREVQDVPTLFESHKGYIDVDSNLELIELLETSEHDLHKVIMKQAAAERVYLLKYHRVDEEQKYVISFTDITEEERLVNIDTKTGLPNVYAITAELEQRIDAYYPFAVDLVTIENIDELLKWHGKQIKDEVDIKVAELLNRNRRESDGYGAIFKGYYGTNKFLLIRDEESHKNVENLVDKIGYLTSAKDEKVSSANMRNVVYRPKHIVIKVERGTSVDDLLKSIKESFDAILF